jgi:hypothetical protein
LLRSVGIGAAIVISLVLTYGVVFQPKDIPTAGIVFVGTVALVGYAGLLGADVVGSVIERLHGTSSPRKRK